MINIDINIKSNFIKQIELKGHAGSGEKGYDLICCSVSTLLIALINGLSEYIKSDIDVKVKARKENKNRCFDKDIFTICRKS